MPDPVAVGAVTKMVTQGVVSLGLNAAKDAMVKRQSTEIEATTVSVTPIPPLPPLPPLTEEAPLGSAFAPAVDQEGTYASQARAITVPEGDFLSGIVGLDYEKSVVRMCVVGQARRHVIMTGPPGSAKSEIIRQLHDMPEVNSIFVDGKQASIPGIANLIVTRQPDVLLIDEIEKMKVEVQEALLVIMDGRVATAKAGPLQSVQETQTQVRVIAAANDPERIISPLYDRFIKLSMPEYTVEQRSEVMKAVLAKKQRLPEAEAERIAATVAPHTTSMRDAERIAEMAKENPELAKQMTERLQRSQAEAKTSTKPKRAA